jgi:proline iminopeptidase
MRFLKHDKWMVKMKFLLLLFLFFSSTQVAVIAHEQFIAYTHAKEEFIETNGQKFFCRIMGKGDPIVVIHGGAGLSQAYLLPQMERLKEHNLVIFYDQRNCGRSVGTFNEQFITVDTFVSDLDAIRKAFGYKKITILGHSFGGFLAVRYAIAHPEAIDKLILLNTAPISSEGWMAFLQEYERRTKPYQGTLKAIEATREFQENDPKIMEEYYRIIFRSYFYAAQKEEFLNLAMSQQAFANGKKVLTILANSLLAQPFDLHEQLKKLTIPTLIIHGDYDMVPYDVAEKIHESISNSQYVLLKHCGHFSYIEAPEQLFILINNFMHAKQLN